MVGIFAKVRTIALGNVHTVLDREINRNSIASVTQHIRDLEDARKDLEGTLAEARFDARNKTTNLTTHKAHAEELTANIKLLMGQNGGAATDQQKASARRMAESLGTLREQIEQETVSAADAEDTANKLTDAVARVNAKEADMKRLLGTLRGQVASAQAKERAASAIEAVASATDAGGSIDGIADQIGRRGARADAAFERSLGGIASDPMASAKADAILAELMK